MSLSFDDKLLGEKVDNYCSSSEDEDHSDDEIEKPSSSLPLNPLRSNTVAQTGPKGVIADYKQYKQLELLKELEKEDRLIDLAHKNSLTARCYKEDVVAKMQDERVRDALEALDDDDDEFLAQYRQNRLRELMHSLERLPVFGKIYDLTSENFVSEIDSTDPKVTVIVHIYEPNDSPCRKINEYLPELSRSYPHVKFCRIRASDALLSYQFTRNGVPAFLVYKNAEVIGNLIQITRDLGSDFYVGDLENYLVERSFLPDKTLGTLLNARLNVNSDDM